MTTHTATLELSGFHQIILVLTGGRINPGIVTNSELIDYENPCWVLMTQPKSQNWRKRMTTYMKIDGITGDVTAKGHENWIAIQSMGFNIKRTLSATPGRLADRESTRPAISEITLTKRMDKTSPHLFIESCTGKAKNVQIDICQSNNNELTPYASFTLRNAIISGYDLDTNNTNQQLTPTNKNSHPAETITLSFDQIEMKYTPFDEQNNPQSPIPAGYDLKQAAEM